jgi:hypothetical protein
MGGREIGGGAHADIHFYHLFTVRTQSTPGRGKSIPFASLRLLFISPQIGANEEKISATRSSLETCLHTFSRAHRELRKKVAESNQGGGRSRLPGKAHIGE